MPAFLSSAKRHHGLLLLACCASAVAGEPQHYKIDPVHTRVVFSIDHAGFSRAVGTISGSEGSLHFDPETWQGAHLEVRVPMHRLDMGDSGWTASVLAPRFLDVKRYPQAYLVVDQLVRGEGNHGRACGKLTLHGVTRPLCMDVTLNRAAHYPLPPFRSTLGFSASASLKRSDYGMTRWKSLVGDTVDIRIEAELHRSNAPSPRPAPPDMAADATTTPAADSPPTAPTIEP